MRNDELTYDWLDFLAEQKSVRKKLFKEEIVRDFVGSNVAKTAQAVGAIDLEFQRGSGDQIILDPSWLSQNIITLTLHDGQKLKFNKNYAELLKSTFEKACEATRTSPNGYYCPRNNGGFNPRTMRKKANISNHTFGTAIDFETASTQLEVTRHPEFINTMKKGDGNIGFIWGGDWSPQYYDPMHFEVDFKNSPTSLISKTVSTPASSAAVAKPSASPNAEDIKAQEKFLSYIPPEEMEKIFTESLDKKIFHIKDKTKNKLYTKYEKYFDSLLDHLKNELKINKPVKIVLEEDEENGNKVLGRTGGYINQEDKIHIFCSNRHVKDIMRSLAHEMVHHRQNIRGEFKKSEPTENGYAQKNPHLRKMEKEAFLKGNMLFRDWEDNYKYRGEK